MAKTFDHLESARFVQASDAAMDKLTLELEKSLADSAARGFPTPGGDTLQTVLGMTQETKGGIAEANGKIYEERNGQLFEIQKFALDYLVRVAKFAMELYRERLFNAIAIEAAQLTAATERSHADVSRLNVQTEARMVGVMRDKADMEARIAGYKQQLVTAETVTMGQESVLVDAQLTTAEKKLEIIDSTYQVLAAERLVLAAERRKAASLQLVLAAEQIVAETKKEMVPFYITKAQALETLAQATINEIPILKALEELGYDRIALRNAEEDEKHQERQQELQYEIAEEGYARAHNVQEIAKKQLSRLLLEYGNQIRATILNQKKQLQEDEVAFKLATGLAREAITVSNEIDVLGHEMLNLDSELATLLRNIEKRALDDTATVAASAIRMGIHITDHLYSRAIREGFIVGTSTNSPSFALPTERPPY